MKLIERLFENSRFRWALAIWSCLSAAALISMVNSVFKPQIMAPPEMISDIDLSKTTPNDISLIKLQWSRNLNDLREIDSLFRALGIAHPSVHLKISSAEPLKYRTDSDTVELGVDYVLAPGQLAHAILQNWYARRRAIECDADRLQQIIFADVLWSAAHGSFELGIPKRNDTISLTKDDIENLKLQDLMFHLASTEELSTSEWAIPALRKLNSPQSASVPASILNPLSLRKFLLSQILKSEVNLGIEERIRFIQNIASNNLRAWPKFDLKIKNLESFVNESFADIGIRARVDENSMLVDVFFNSADALKTALPFTLSYIAKNPDGLTLLPGNIIVTEDDLIHLRVHTLVVSVQNMSDLKKIVSTSVAAKKILAIENPHTELVHFDALKKLDFEKFAKRNKKIRFAVFDRESLVFATEKHLDQSLAQLLESTEPRAMNLAAASDTLGVTTAHWDSISQTYRASGHIEALQMWRPAIHE